jgi:hypothetical protein
MAVVTDNAAALLLLLLVMRAAAFMTDVCKANSCSDVAARDRSLPPAANTAAFAAACAGVSSVTANPKPFNASFCCTDSAAQSTAVPAPAATAATLCVNSATMSIAAALCSVHTPAAAAAGAGTAADAVYWRASKAMGMCKPAELVVLVLVLPPAAAAAAAQRRAVSSDVMDEEG